MLAAIYVGISRRNKHEANMHGFLELGAKLSECILDYFDDLCPIGRVMLNPRREIKPMFLQDCLYSQVQTAEKSRKCHIHKGCFSEYSLCTHSAWWITGWLWLICVQVWYKGIYTCNFRYLDLGCILLNLTDVESQRSEDIRKQLRITSLRPNFVQLDLVEHCLVTICI